MKAKLYFLLILIVVSSPVYAQSDASVLPSEIKQRTVVNELLTLKKGYFQVGTSFVLNTLNRTFDEDGTKIVDPDNSSLNGFFNFSFITVGISDRIQLEVATRYQNQQLNGSTLVEYSTGLFSQQVINEVPNSGIGDTDIVLSYQPFKPDFMGSGLVITGVLGVPTGRADYENLLLTSEKVSYDAPVGRGEYSFTPRLRYRKVLFPFSVDLLAEYRIPFGGSKMFFVPDSNPRLEQFNFTGIKVFSFTTNLNIQLNDWIALKHGILFQNIQQEDIDGLDLGLSSAINFQYYPYVSFQIRQLRIEQAVNIPLLGKNSPANIGYAILVKYLF